ncbi:MAG: ABC-F family ATP-binding cassette domain-containing protein [Clostridiales Family XIII bacterium]|nr:ABC-F family ATP-binding cassette domain-containing protein [Clostridiales Family XIII bacterium]
MLVTHDRYFLDRTVNRIFEIERQHLTVYPGNYSEYVEKKKLVREQELRAYENQRAEIRRQEDIIRHMKERGTEKLSKRAASREKRLDMMARLERPDSELRAMKLRFGERIRSGSDVLEGVDLSKGFASKARFADSATYPETDSATYPKAASIIYPKADSTTDQEASGATYPKAGDTTDPETSSADFPNKSDAHHPARRELFRDVNFDIKRGERICLVGANGVGKTTLLRMVLGQTPPDKGYLNKGVNVCIGYYEQEQIFPDSERTVLEEMTATYRRYSESEMRGILARFMFTGDMAFRKISVLSGGERAKLALVKLFLSDSNMLILDEPTNHLDIPSREAIEDALLEYSGTVLVVSHDRYFLNKVPTRIAELTPDGLVFYSGKYDYYMEKKNEAGSGKAYMRTLSGNESVEKKEDEPLSDAAAERQRKKREDAERRRRESAIKTIEARITELEGQIARTEAQIASPEAATDPARLTELTELLDVLHRALDAKLAEWENASMS